MQVDEVRPRGESVGPVGRPEAPGLDARGHGVPNRGEPARGAGDVADGARIPPGRHRGLRRELRNRVGVGGAIEVVVRRGERSIVRLGRRRIVRMVVLGVMLRPLQVEGDAERRGRRCDQAGAGEGGDERAETGHGAILAGRREEVKP